MKNPYQIIEEAEINLDEYMEWQVNFGPTRNFKKFAESTADAQSLFKYAAILYPRFLEVEGAIVLADHYSDENWAAWRKTHDPIAAARVINHVHVEDYLPSDFNRAEKLERPLGEMLAFFWHLAVNYQFPGSEVIVEYDGNIIDIYQEPSDGNAQENT